MSLGRRIHWSLDSMVHARETPLLHNPLFSFPYKAPVYRLTKHSVHFSLAVSTWSPWTVGQSSRTHLRFTARRLWARWIHRSVMLAGGVWLNRSQEPVLHLTLSAPVVFLNKGPTKWQQHMNVQCYRKQSGHGLWELGIYISLKHLKL